MLESGDSCCGQGSGDEAGVFKFISHYSRLNETRQGQIRYLRFVPLPGNNSKKQVIFCLRCDAEDAHALHPLARFCLMRLSSVISVTATHLGDCGGD